RHGAVGGLADHLDAVLGVQQGREPGPDQGLVVGQQHPDHRGSMGSVFKGRRARTAKPPPTSPPPFTGRGPAVSAPPSAVARSVMPRIPRPPPLAPPRGGPGRSAPSSSTSITRSPSSGPILTLTREACACRTTLVSASCTIRYPAASTPRGGDTGVTRTSTLRPVASARRTRSGT